MGGAEPRGESSHKKSNMSAAKKSSSHLVLSVMGDQTDAQFAGFINAQHMDFTQPWTCDTLSIASFVFACRRLTKQSMARLRSLRVTCVSPESENMWDEAAVYIKQYGHVNEITVECGNISASRSVMFSAFVHTIAPSGVERMWPNMSIDCELASSSDNLLSALIGVKTMRLELHGHGGTEWGASVVTDVFARIGQVKDVVIRRLVVSGVRRMNVEGVRALMGAGSLGTGLQVTKSCHCMPILMEFVREKFQTTDLWLSMNMSQGAISDAEWELVRVTPVAKQLQFYAINPPVTLCGEDMQRVVRIIATRTNDSETDRFRVVGLSEAEEARIETECLWRRTADRRKIAEKHFADEKREKNSGWAPQLPKTRFETEEERYSRYSRERYRYSGPCMVS